MVDCARSPISYSLEEDDQASRLSEFDTELIDKIKIAITKLKTTTCEKKKTRLRTAKFLCSIRDKNCNSNQDAIFCTHCASWVHRKCNVMSKEEYTRLSSEPNDAPFQCFLSVIKENSEIFPYSCWINLNFLICMVLIFHLN